MGADQLLAWEVILQSPVAVSLLLLGAVAALAAAHLAWVRGVLAENRKLHRWIREHLESEAGVARALDDLRPLLELIRGYRDPSPPSSGPPSSEGRAGVARVAPVGRAPAREAEAGDAGQDEVRGDGA